MWENGALVRSLSVTARDVLEDIGTPLDFERPYWAGEHPVGGTPGHRPYPLPFHPLELGAEAAMRSLFAFILEGRMQDTDIDPQAVRLIGYKVRAADPVTEAEVREFIRTHTRRQYRFGPDGTLTPAEE